MPTVLYCLMVWWLPELDWSWGWFFVSLLFTSCSDGGGGVRRIYRYTANKELDGKDLKSEGADEARG